MCYIPAKPMALDSVIPVRFEANVKARLNAVAEKARLKPSDLIRRAVEDFLLHAESSGEINLTLEERPKDASSRNPVPRPPKKPVNYKPKS